MVKRIKLRSASFAVLLILSAYLLSRPLLNIKLAQAQTAPTTSFSLQVDSTTPDYGPGNNFNVKVLVRSDTTSTNLFSAKISYDSTFLKVNSLDMTTPSFVNNIVEATSSATTINLIGGYSSSSGPNTGFTTNSTDPPSTFATISFQRLASGPTKLSFIPLDSSTNKDGTAIFSNTTNQNILASSPDFTLDNTLVPTATPTLVPTATPPQIGGYQEGSYQGSYQGSYGYTEGSYSPGAPASPAKSSGDVNGDGHVGLDDLSILLSQYGTSNPQSDVNGDGVVNLLDLSILLSHYQGG